MATFSNKPGRPRMIQLKDQSSKVHTFRLGKTNASQARLIHAHVQNLEAAKKFGVAAPAETLQWLSRVEGKLHGKLVSAGLTESRTVEASPAQIDEMPAVRIKNYFTDYISRRTDLKPRSISNLEQSCVAAWGYFGEARDMRTINKGEIRDYKRSLLSRFAEATVAMHIKKLRQVYEDAIEHGVVSKNPVKGVAAGRMSNSRRQQYVPRETIQKLIGYCTNLEWKLLFAMARFAGPRVPSEIKDLRWSDILWDDARIVIRSPKTERYPDRERREIPMFKEIKSLLLEAFTSAAPDAVYVFPELRQRRGLSTLARKMIIKSGLAPWPKTLQNLRSSCETDLASKYSIHVACEWIGNTAATALKHYLAATQDDFDSAAGEGAVKSAVRSDENNEGDPSGDLVLAINTPKGSRFPLNYNQNMQAAHKALQKALHSVKGDIPRIRRQLIQKLEHEVDAAKKRGGR